MIDSLPPAVAMRWRLGVGLHPTRSLPTSHGPLGHRRTHLRPGGRHSRQTLEAAPGNSTRVGSTAIPHSAG